MITLDTEIPTLVPNPPPWCVKYVPDNGRYSIPVAYTFGLAKFGKKELLIAEAPPNIAIALLDRLGIYLIYEGGKYDGSFQFAGKSFDLVPRSSMMEIKFNHVPGG